MNIPNILTAFRIILIPVLVLVYYLPFAWNYTAACVVFVAAAVTDYFDGYLARKLDQMTPFGAFLDPVADKLMVAVALVLLTEQYSSPWFAVPAAIIIGREIVISALREWMAELGKRTSVAVSYIGKVKTFVQMVSLTVLLAFPNGSGVMSIFGLVLLYIAAGLTLWSMVIYIRAAWGDLMGPAIK
jgi:CDP-diacylglycerol--glycerol-3-phosphate 3-phosphatidyltransferase